MGEHKNHAMDMLVDPQILVAAGAIFRKYAKGQVIFHEGDMPGYYYQVISGEVTMMNIRESGTDFIQGMFREGQAFGSPALMLNEPYPASAVANRDVVLVRLPREAFLQVLEAYPDVLLSFSKMLCRLLYHKAFIGKGIASQGPEERINTLLDILKKESNCPADEKYRLSLSRQQIADMIGLRVETVIRTMKKLEEKGAIAIDHGKVYY
jgi:CRP-like cAMP-binding protein